MYVPYAPQPEKKIQQKKSQLCNVLYPVYANGGSSCKMKNVVTNPHDTPAERVRNVTQYLYPDILILVFIFVGASYSIYNARKEEVVVPEARGPGGKPLPATKRRKGHVEPDRYAFSPTARIFFQWASILTTLTFLGAGITISARALVYRAGDGENGWWCGEPKTVCFSLFIAVVIVKATAKLTIIPGFHYRLSSYLGILYPYSF